MNYTIQQPPAPANKPLVEFNTDGTANRQPEFPCWQFRSSRWEHRWFKCDKRENYPGVHFTHWSPDSPTAPTERPDSPTLGQAKGT